MRTTTRRESCVVRVFDDPKAAGDFYSERARLWLADMPIDIRRFLMSGRRFLVSAIIQYWLALRCCFLRVLRFFVVRAQRSCCFPESPLRATFIVFCFRSHVAHNAYRMGGVYDCLTQNMWSVCCLLAWCLYTQTLIYVFALRYRECMIVF